MTMMISGTARIGLPRFGVVGGGALAGGPSGGGPSGPSGVSSVSAEAESSSHPALKWGLVGVGAAVGVLGVLGVISCVIPAVSAVAAVIVPAAVYIPSLAGVSGDVRYASTIAGPAILTASSGTAGVVSLVVLVVGLAVAVAGALLVH
jgi:hypothetical protein